jgi:hypothetical protein
MDFIHYNSGNFFGIRVKSEYRLPVRLKVKTKLAHVFFQPLLVLIVQCRAIC